MDENPFAMLSAESGSDDSSSCSSDESTTPETDSESDSSDASFMGPRRHAHADNSARRTLTPGECNAEMHRACTDGDLSADLLQARHRCHRI